VSALTSVALTRADRSEHPAWMNDERDGLVRITPDPSLPNRFSSLRSFISYRVQVHPKLAKTVAGLMGKSPSLLSKKLSGRGTNRLNCDDLECYMRSTGDTSPIEYLAAKFLQTDDAREARAIARVEMLATELEKTLRHLKGRA
jgi:hypothetical protein